MKEKLIEIFNLKYVAATKWNEIYQSNTHIFVFNRATKECKIKPKM